MAQVKKEFVRQAILHAAYRLFQEQGYVGTKLQDIATAAKISRANIYVYFGSKFELLYAVFNPWLLERLAELESELSRIDEPRARLTRIFTALWRDIPGEANGFANNLMQALSTASNREGYSPALLSAAKARVASMIDRCVTGEGRREIESQALAHVIFMAFDGFSMHAHLGSSEACSDTVIDSMCNLIIGKTRTPIARLRSPKAATRHAIERQSQDSKTARRRRDLSTVR